MHIGIIIPSYQPEQVLIDLLEQLVTRLEDHTDTIHLVVIDDGSDNPQSLEIFSSLSNFQNMTLLQHKANRGKGAAIKTGMAFAIEKKLDFIVTADDDGQHEVNDIVSILDRTIETDGFVIGSRQFDQTTPLRSRVGNSLTAFLFRILFKTRLSDTQTGLRGIPKRLFPLLLLIPHDRYEFEFQSLVDICKIEDIIEVPISTIYEEGNPSSHFRPIIDSALIYLVLFRYSFVALCVAALDVVAFCFLAKLVSPILAFIYVRTATVTVYFAFVRSFVFKSNADFIGQSVKFLLLVLANMFLVAFAISSIERAFPITIPVIYILSTLILFGFNFMVQRYVIFRD